MTVKLELDGRCHTGVGYCKRYSWTPAPRHWGYRFVQGFVYADADAGATSVWTAEATFGNAKYDYFHLLPPHGETRAALDGGSCHRQNAVYANTADGAVTLALEELAVWECPLQSAAMDSLLRQRVCRLTVATDD